MLDGGPILVQHRVDVSCLLGGAIWELSQLNTARVQT